MRKRALFVIKFIFWWLTLVISLTTVPLWAIVYIFTGWFLVGVVVQKWTSLPFEE